MKKLFALATAALILSACSSTWYGAKEDTNRNWDKTREKAERVADKTSEAVRKGGNAVGRGMSHVGEKIEAATE